MGRFISRVGSFFRRKSWARLALFVSIDFFIVFISTLLAYWARFGGAVSQAFLEDVYQVAVASGILYVVAFAAFGLYRHVWKYVSVDLFAKLVSAIAVGLLVLVVVDLYVETYAGERPAPIGVLVMAAAFTLIGSAALRSLGRLAVHAQSSIGTRAGARRVLIIGAGDAGSLLLRDIENQPALGINVVGFVDDDRVKWRRVIRGVPVLGGTEKLPAIVESREATEALIALPSATPTQLSHALDACAAAGLTTRIVPSMVLDSGSVQISDLRSVDIHDLLGRDPAPIDLNQVADMLNDRTVLVTGAAGSIGAELCRQILAFGPQRLIALDIDETRLHDVHLELSRLQPDAAEMRICDIRDKLKLDRLFVAEQPHVVFHAAAYKHVPIMEREPDEAVRTNVLGTRNVIEACEKLPDTRLALISTDKAVAPTSVMGSTKAIAELLAMNACASGLKATAVRFGNVLGSRGSVVPVFEAQLRGGRPLQVTHPEATRYFMTIEEAARLVLQACALDHAGTIYVLDMGEPVRIVDLARKMLSLSGSSSRIEFVGLRPAEKMHEVLVHSHEDLLETEAQSILSVSACPRIDAELETMVSDLISAAEVGDVESIRRATWEILGMVGTTREDLGATLPESRLP